MRRTNPPTTFAHAVVVIALTATGSVRAATYYVAPNGSDANPGTSAQPFQHIQHGIDAAAAGDTVLVQSGVYSGSGNTPLEIQRDITVKGTTGPDNCIIDGGASGRCLRIDNGVSSACVLQGFTIRNGYCSDTVDGDPRGAGLFINNASPTVQHCVFSGNTVKNMATGNAYGGAVYVTTTAPVSRNSSPTFLNCTFSNNQVVTYHGQGSGGALEMAAGGTLTMSDCVVSNNQVVCTSAGTSCYGGGVDATTDAALLRCSFTGNQLSAVASGQSGGGGGLASHANTTISACQFTSNETSLTGTSAGGGYYQTGGSCVMKNSIFRLNISQSQGGSGVGGGAELDSSLAAVLNVAVYGNKAVGGVAGGGGICAGGATVGMYNVSFADNTAQASGTLTSVGGGYQSGAGNSTTIVNGAFDRNQAKSGAELAAWNNGTTHGAITISNSFARGSITGPVTLGAGMVYAVNGPSPFVDAFGGDLHEAAGAVTIDAGDNSVASLFSYDLEGHARRQGAAVDIGAYEFGSAPAQDLYVDRANGSDSSGAGTSSSPFQTVSHALQFVTDPLAQALIHIAAGNYSSDLPHVTTNVRFINWNNTGRASIGKQ